MTTRAYISFTSPSNISSNTFIGRMTQPSEQSLAFINRNLTTTPPTTTSAATSFDQSSSIQPGPVILTPPTSPAECHSSTDQPRHEGLCGRALSGGTDDKDGPLSSRLPDPLFSYRPGSIYNSLICPFDVKVLSDRQGGNEVFGSGAWSTVFKATPQQAPSSLGLTTPPMSPTSPRPLLLAVKVPTRKGAETILEHEGHILTYLTSLPGAEKFVVHFYGLFPKFSSLVLAAIPLSLEDHILSCALTARQTVSTWNMSDPVIGNTRKWLDLAYKLISALQWLHEEAEVVHGDIKPGNFLLRPISSTEGTNQLAFQPVFIDFSSSHLLKSGNAHPNSLSAVTREYTAPELLSSEVLRDPKSTATCASDVFSTAVTLLVAATGNTRVYTGSVFQRQAMATQGWQILQLVSNGDQGSRLPRHGIVQRTLDRAVLKAGMGRVSARQWLTVVEELTREEPSKVP